MARTPRPHLSPAKSRPSGGCLRHAPAGAVFRLAEKKTAAPRQKKTASPSPNEASLIWLAGVVGEKYHQIRHPCTGCAPSGSARESFPASGGLGVSLGYLRKACPSIPAAAPPAKRIGFILTAPATLGEAGSCSRARGTDCPQPPQVCAAAPLAGTQWCKLRRSAQPAQGGNLLRTDSLNSRTQANRSPQGRGFAA